MGTIRDVGITVTQMSVEPEPGNRTGSSGRYSHRVGGVLTELLSNFEDARRSKEVRWGFCLVGAEMNCGQEERCGEMAARDRAVHSSHRRDEDGHRL